MKILLTSLLAIFLLHNSTSTLVAQQPSFKSHAADLSTLSWVSSYDEALAQAKESNQSVVLLFTGSDWCHWCKVMEKEFLADKTFIRNLKNEFLFVCVDFPKSFKLPTDLAEENQRLFKRYNVNGFPTLVVLNAEGRALGRSGYRTISPAQFAAELQAMRHSRS